jgi:predicted MFS family arabinose efflux permease
MLVTAALSLIVYGLLTKADHSWSAASVTGSIVAGIALLALFGWVEARTRNPLVPLGFLRSRRRALGNIVLLAYSAAMAVLFFSMALYLQQVAHLGAVYTGLSFLPIGPVFMLTGGLTARLIARAGQRCVAVTGLLLLTAAFALFAQVHVGGPYVRDVLIGMIIFPAGAGFAVISSMIASVDGATGRDAGLAGGINNTAQQIGMALGLAALVPVGEAHAQALRASGSNAAQAAAAGYSFTFTVTAALMAVTAIVAAVGFPARPRRAHVTAAGQAAGQLTGEENRRNGTA